MGYMSLRIIRSRPVLVLSVALFVWLFFYLLIVLGPEFVHEIRASSIVRGCEEIKPGMTSTQALAVMHRRYQPPEESYAANRITFIGYDSGCVVDLSEQGQRVKGAHVDPDAKTWFLINQ